MKLKDAPWKKSYDKHRQHIKELVLLLLLSRFSRVRLCATPQTAAHQAPLSLGFSRQEHWSGLPFPSPVHESEVARSCPTLYDPMDCSLPGSSIHGIFPARVLKWGAKSANDLIEISLDRLDQQVSQSLLRDSVGILENSFHSLPVK